VKTFLADFSQANSSKFVLMARRARRCAKSGKFLPYVRRCEMNARVKALATQALFLLVTTVFAFACVAGRSALDWENDDAALAAPATGGSTGLSNAGGSVSNTANTSAPAGIGGYWVSTGGASFASSAGGLMAITGGSSAFVGTGGVKAVTGGSSAFIGTGGVKAVTGGSSAFIGTGGITSSGTAVPTGGATASSGSCNPPADAGQFDQELMTRWNQAAASVSTNVSFTWDEFDRFPHPTYKLGTPDAYQSFARVLLAFFQAGDNFDFLAKNNLFRSSLMNLGPIGTFEEFADYFSSTSHSELLGGLPANTRVALAAYATRIHELCGETPSTTPPTPDAGQFDQELMTRWNQAAASVSTNVSFTWDPFDNFPHPTYKGGTPEAYQGFARVLLAFFQAGDNFAFLAKNELFLLPVYDQLLSGRSEWTFEQLADSFSSTSTSTWDGLPENLRVALAAYAARIHELIGDADAGSNYDAAAP
jgi:hypothetical protein